MSAEELYDVCYDTPVNVGELKGLLEKGADPNGYKNSVSVRHVRRRLLDVSYNARSWWSPVPY